MSFEHHPQIQELCRVEGYAYWKPRRLEHEEDWGDLLGFSKTGLTFLPGLKTIPVRQEITGNQVMCLIHGGYAPTVTIQLRNYNTLALARLFPGIVEETRVYLPGEVLPGTNLFDPFSEFLLFVPSDQENNPAVLMHCIPHVVASTKMLFSHQQDLIFPAIFWMVKKCQVGRMEELRL